LMALPSVVESNWKSIAHTTFGPAPAASRAPQPAYADCAHAPAGPPRATAGGSSSC
jgi:hypothetical protein